MIEAVNPYLCSIIGVFGIISAITLLFGMEKKSSTDVLWWMVFQWINLIHQVYASILFLEALHSSNVEKLRNFAFPFMFFHVFLETYFFYEICLIYSSFQDRMDLNLKRNESTLVLNHDEERLPSYQEAIAFRA